MAAGGGGQVDQTARVLGGEAAAHMEAWERELEAGGYIHVCAT